MFGIPEASKTTPHRRRHAHPHPHPRFAQPVGERTDPLAHGAQYAHDSANRLINVDGVAQTWDANGNLLNEGGCILTPTICKSSPTRWHHSQVCRMRVQAQGEYAYDARSTEFTPILPKAFATAGLQNLRRVNNIIMSMSTGRSTPGS